MLLQMAAHLRCLHLPIGEEVGQTMELASHSFSELGERVCEWVHLIHRQRGHERYPSIIHHLESNLEIAVNLKWEDLFRTIYILFLPSKSPISLFLQHQTKEQGQSPGKSAPVL